MRPFRVETGLVAPLPRADVDTDQIIPKQFLTRVGRSGFEDCLFHDWRSDPVFVLNQARYQAASVLVTGSNFGCGSSREHAAWALRDAGFRVILAPSFADIFIANCTNNGLLCVSLTDDVVDAITESARNLENYFLTVDLERCELRDVEGYVRSFTIDPFRRERLLNAFDEVAVTLQWEDEIARHERSPEVVSRLRHLQGQNRESGRHSESH